MLSFSLVVGEAISSSQPIYFVSFMLLVLFVGMSLWCFMEVSISLAKQHVGSHDALKSVRLQGRAFPRPWPGHGGLAVAFCCAAISFPWLLFWAPQLRKSLQGFQSGTDEIRLGLAHAHHAARAYNRSQPSPGFLSALSRFQPVPSALQHFRGLGRSLGAVSSDARQAAGCGVPGVLCGRATKTTAP